MDIPGKGNMGKLKTSFTYSMIEIKRKEINFVDSLVNILGKGGDCDSNCAIVMALIGAFVGYQDIPTYFISKILTANV